MRQVVQPMPRPSRPAPGTTGTQLPIRQAQLRQFVIWLVLVSGPTALLLIETAGNKAP